MSVLLSRLELSDLDGSHGFRIDGATADDISGMAVGSAGDLNDDGVADILIGAPGVSLHGTGSGAAFVVFGNTGGFDNPMQLSAMGGGVGLRIPGASAGDAVGGAVASGDVNGDGIADLVIGASHLVPEVPVTGGVYVIFGRSDGYGPSLELSGITPADGFRIDGIADGDHTGNAVAAGDLNGDGIADLVIGAPGLDAGGDYAGGAYVVFGRSDIGGAPIVLSALDGSTGFRLDGGTTYDGTGFALSVAGDVNGDGIGDLIIGTEHGGVEDDFSGASYVVFGRSDGFPDHVALSGLDGATGFRILGESAGDHAGLAVSSAGDVNGDGIGDLIVGAYRGGTNGLYAGGAYVIFGRSDGFDPMLHLAALAGSDGFRINGANEYDYAGGAVAAAGDVNGDGFDDVIVGAYGATPRGDFSGAAYVIFGRSRFADALDLFALDGTNGYTIRGATAGDEAGWSVAGAGDVNGDGLDDMLVGAPYADGGGDYSGATFVVFGQAVAPANWATTFVFSNDTGTAGDLITREASQTVSGTLHAPLREGEWVQVSLDGGEHWVHATVTAGSDTWSLSGVTLTGSGLLSVRTGNADAINTPHSRAYELITSIDPVAPPVLAPPSDTGSSDSDNVTTDRTPSFTGTAQPFTTITLYIGDTEIGTGTADADGNWSVTARALPRGTHDIVVTMTDIAGNVSTAEEPLMVTTLRTTPTDMNQDGISDVVFHRENNIAATWELDAGSDVAVQRVLGIWADDWTEIGRGDVNGDGVADLLFQNDSMSFRIEAWTVGNGVVVRNAAAGYASQDWTYIDTGDFTGDGTDDLLFRNTQTGQLGIWRMQNSVSVQGIVLDPLPPGAEILGVGDLNGDGTSDIVTVTQGTAVLSVLFMAGGAVQGVTELGSLQDGWLFRGIGDFNSDGADDLLLQNADTTEIAVVQVVDGSIIDSYSLGETGKDTDVVDFSDYNGDGTADILLHQADGTVLAWLLRDGAVVGTRVLGGTDSAWHVN